MHSYVYSYAYVYTYCSSNDFLRIVENFLLNILRLAMKKSMTIDFFIAIFYSYREK